MKKRKLNAKYLSSNHKNCANAHENQHAFELIEKPKLSDIRVN